MCERGEDRRIPRVIKFCHNREIEDWLFFKDDRPVVLPKNARSSHALTYVSNIKGPLTDSVLQPFSILNTVEWEESSYMLGSATGFRAGDARFFFPGERVELTGRRMAIDFSTDMPVLWETQFFTNNHVVISWQMHTQYGEARRITEVFDLDEPEVLKYRSLFHETRACDFCTARNDLCDCAQTLRDRCFQHLPLEWKASRSQPGDASLQQFNNFASIFFHGKRGALWKFTIEGLIGDTLKTISSNDWNVDYYYSTNGLELESLHSSFLQARIFTLQSPRKRAIEKRYEYDEDEVGNEGMVKEERNIMVSSAFLEGDRPGESSPSLGEDGFRVEKGKKSNPSCCPVCKAVFGRVYEMKRHMASVHMLIRDYACDRCDKRFSQKGHLKKHMFAVHEDIREETCPACKLKFRTKCKTMRHFRAVHLNIRPNKCETCGSSFQQKSDVKRHILAKHPHLLSPKKTKNEPDTSLAAPLLGI